jgi:dTDP-4-dehydrorhamnose 3,5-epimerase
MALQTSIGGMKVIETPLLGVLVLQPQIFGDDRGFFLESYNQRTMTDLGITEPLVQDNHSYSARNVLRGLHYQVNLPQGKLVRAIAGEIFDVAVDLRRSSPSFGTWYGTMLSGENKRMMWVPAGLAHGFLVRSETVHVLYKATDYYSPENERSIIWNDSRLNIDWQLEGEPGLSNKDRLGVTFEKAEKFD